MNNRLSGPARAGFTARILARLFGTFLERRGWHRLENVTYHYTDAVSYWWYGPYGKGALLWRYEPDESYAEFAHYSDTSTLDAVLTEIAKMRWENR